MTAGDLTSVRPGVSAPGRCGPREPSTGGTSNGAVAQTRRRAPRARACANQAFTLIELLVVIAVIAIRAP